MTVFQRFKPSVWTFINHLVFFTSCILFYYSSSKLYSGEWVLEKYSQDIYTISASIIAAYIFYVINSILPKIKDDINYKSIISKRIEEIITDLSKYIFIINNQRDLGEMSYPVENFNIVLHASKNITTNEKYKSEVLINPNSRDVDILDSSILDSSILVFILETISDAKCKIARVRDNLLVKEHELLVVLEEIEDKLANIVKVLSILKNLKVDAELSGVLNLADFEGLFNQSKQLAKYYNNHLNTGKNYFDTDVWFNNEPHEKDSNNNVNSLMNIKKLSSKV